MGREAEVLVKFDGHCLPAKAHLESDILHLKTDHRLSVRFNEVTECSEQDGWLTLKYGLHRLDLHLGIDAPKWHKAIVSPPTLLDKLGVKPGMKVAELGFHEAVVPEASKDLAVTFDLVLLNVVKPDDLDQIRPARLATAARGAIWVVYPRGSKTIPERLIRQECLTDSWVDVKTCRFDETRTALKFVRRR